MNLRIEVQIENPEKFLRVFNQVTEIVKNWLASDITLKSYFTTLFVTDSDDVAWKFLNLQAPSACVLINEPGRSVRDDIDEFQKVIQTPEANLKNGILEALKLFAEKPV